VLPVESDGQTRRKPLQARAGADDEYVKRAATLRQAVSQSNVEKAI
jgi:hypothetical protein